MLLVLFVLLVNLVLERPLLDLNSHERREARRTWQVDRAAD